MGIIGDIIESVSSGKKYYVDEVEEMEETIRQREGKIRSELEEVADYEEAFKDEMTITVNEDSDRRPVDYFPQAFEKAKELVEDLEAVESQFEEIEGEIQQTEHELKAGEIEVSEELEAFKDVLEVIHNVHATVQNMMVSYDFDTSIEVISFIGDLDTWYSEGYALFWKKTEINISTVEREEIRRIPELAGSIAKISEAEVTEIKRLNQEFEELSSEVSQINQEIEQLDALIRHVRDILEHAQSHVRYGASHDQMDSVQIDKEKKEKIMNLESELNSLENRVNELSQKMSELEDLREEEVKKINQQVSQINTLTQQIESEKEANYQSVENLDMLRRKVRKDGGIRQDIKDTEREIENMRRKKQGTEDEVLVESLEKAISGSYTTKWKQQASQKKWDAAKAGFESSRGGFSIRSCRASFGLRRR